MTDALEQLVEFAPTGIRSREYTTIDQYTQSTPVLYTPPLFSPMGSMPMGYGVTAPSVISPSFDASSLIPRYGLSVIPYGNLTGLGGDVHDTFKTDRYGND